MLSSGNTFFRIHQMAGLVFFFFLSYSMFSIYLGQISRLFPTTPGDNQSVLFEGRVL